MGVFSVASNFSACFFGFFSLLELKNELIVSASVALKARAEIKAILGVFETPAEFCELSDGVKVGVGVSVGSYLEGDGENEDGAIVWDE